MSSAAKVNTGAGAFHRWAKRFIMRKASCARSSSSRLLSTAVSITWIEPLETRLLLSVTILSEDFENDFPSANGWNVFDSEAFDTPAYWGAVDSSFGGEGAHGGVKKGYVAGVGHTGGSVNPNYRDYMRAQMSRVLDLSGHSAATLEFWYKLPSVEFGHDYASIYIDSTPVWERFETATSWTHQIISLDDYAGAPHTLTFIFYSDYIGTAEGWYVDDILVTNLSSDPDPDDTIDQAYDMGVIPSGGSVARAIQSIDFKDVDMVAFTVAAGQTVGFDIDRTSESRLDSLLRLFDSSGTQLASNDEGFGPAPESSPVDSYLEYVFASSGTYYLGISDYWNAGYDPSTGDGDSIGYITGRYDLTLTDRSPDPDDTIGEAFDLGPISSGGSAAHMGQSIGFRDVDMVAFTVTAGQTIGFDIDRTPNSGLAVLSSYLRLFDANGSQLSFNRNGSGPDPEPYSGDSYLEYIFTASGTYYLGVSDSRNQFYNPTNGLEDSSADYTAGYDLIITDRPSDPDDTIGEAINLGVVPSIGSVSLAGQSIDFNDVDIVAFTVAAGQTLGFDVDKTSGTLDSRLHLYDAAGLLLASNNEAIGPAPESGFSNIDPYLEYSFIDSGTYYLGISSSGNNAYDPFTGTADAFSSTNGGYNLTIMDRLDEDDTIAEAFDLGPVPTGGSVIRVGQSIDFKDVDMIAFTASAGQIIGFDIDTTSNSGLDGFLRLFNAAGAELTSVDNAAGPAPEVSGYEPFLEYAFTTAGTYYLGVSNSGNRSYSPSTGMGDSVHFNSYSNSGGYELTLTDQSSDFDDTIAEAFDMGVIPPAGSSARVGQSIGLGTDVDMVAFTVAAGQTLGFDIDIISGSFLNSAIRLFNAAGTMLFLNHDAPGPAPENHYQESYQEYTFTTDGVYFLGISASSNTNYNPTTGTDDTTNTSSGGYDLIITDRVDPDDTIGEAFNLGLIPPGGSVLHAGRSIDFRDVDMVAFTVTAGQTVGFDIDRTVTSNENYLDSVLRLFGASGGLILSNNNGYGPAPEPGFNDSYLEFTFAATGTYYLGISASGNESYSSTAGTGDSSTTTIGDYDLIITDRPPDSDDTIGEAFDLGVIPAGGSVARRGQSIDIGTDVDMVAFTVAGGQTLGFDIDANGFGNILNSYLKLFDAAGTSYLSNDNGVGPAPEPKSSDSYLSAYFPSGGTYYLGISTADNPLYSPTTGADYLSGGSYGNYDLIITNLVADLDDTIAEAFDLGLIAVGESVSYTRQSIDYQDVDMVAFTVSTGQIIGFDVDRTPGGDLNSYLRLFNAAGLQLAANDGAAGPAPEPYSDDSFLEYTFTAPGTYYLGISENRNPSYNQATGTGDSISFSSTSGGYNLIITDRIDPDDTIDEAFDLGPIHPGGSASRMNQSIDFRDVDMFTFTVSAGQTLGFDIDRTLGSGLDSYLRLFTAAGLQLSANDYGAGPTPEPNLYDYYDSYLEYTFMASGTYHLGVSTYGAVGYNPTTGTGDTSGTTFGGYDLIITDRIDSDDTISEAFDMGAIPPGGQVARMAQSIDPGTDVDMVAFTAAAGQTLGFDIDRTLGSRLDSYLRLFDASGNLLTSNGDDVGPTPEESNLESHLEYTFVSDGIYYLGISAGSNFSFNTGSGGYDLIITDRPPDTDDTIGEAFVLGMIELGGSLSRLNQSIDFKDVDLFAFIVSAGQTLGFDIDRTLGSGLDSYLRLFNAGGLQLSANYNGAGPLPEFFGDDSYLQYTFIESGTYYLGVSASGNASYNPTTGTGDRSFSYSFSGGYDLIITDRPPDSDDTISEAFDMGTITPGGSAALTSQRIDLGTDVDMVGFTALAGQTLGFDIDRKSGDELNSLLRLFDFAGNLLASNSDGAGTAPEESNLDSYLEYTFAADGIYYLGISAEGNFSYNPTNGTADASGGSFGGYDLIITDRPPDSDDAIGEAFNMGVIPSGGSVSRLARSIDTGMDVDMVAFTVSAGQTLGFDIDRTSGGGLRSYLRLFNAAGNVVASKGSGAGPTPEESNLDSYLEYSFIVTGTYYLGISAAGNISYNSTTGAEDAPGDTFGGYDLIITDRIDLDDTIDEAFDLGTIPLGGSVTRMAQTIDPGTDVDMVAFTAATGQILGFDIDRNMGGVLNSRLRLFDFAGNLLASNDDGVGLAPEESNLDSYFEYTFVANGVYYLGVSARSNFSYNPTSGTADVSDNTFGGYDLIITDLTVSFNFDGVVNALDIDLLYAGVQNVTFNARYDLNGDGRLNQADVDVLIKDILETEYGDADLDRAVSLGDLVILAGNFEQPGGWAQGDFNGDGVVTIGDLVVLAANFISAALEPLSGGGDAAGMASDSGVSPDMLRQPPALAEEDEAEAESPFADILAELAAGLRE